MSEVSYALATTAQLKSQLDISVSTWDSVLDQCINGATDYIESQCGGRRFKQTTYTDVIMDGTINYQIPLYWLKLPQLPLGTITAIYYNIGSIATPNWQAFTTQDYQSYSERGEIYFPAALPQGRQNIKITYAAGYSTVPYDLAEVCLRIASKEFNRRKSQGMMNENIGGMSIQWQDHLEDIDKNTIDRYSAALSIL